MPSCLTRGHGYVDGKKSIGFVAIAIFLELNGWSLEAPEPEVVQTVLVVARGKLVEADLSAWVCKHLNAIHQEPD